MTQSIHARLAGRRQRRWAIVCVAAFLVVTSFVSAGRVDAQPPEEVSAASIPPLDEIRIRSSADGTMQPSLYQAPDSANGEPTPMLVFLHSWSGDLRQNNLAWQTEAFRRGWIYLHPNFRGINKTPQACGSKLARQDILDAIDEMRSRYNVDTKRIYLAGTSGGGHMAMLMAAHHPDRFSAVSSWVGISDLASWYQFHVRDGEPQKYARMILASLEGPPGKSPQINLQYRDRSPIFHLRRAVDVPIDIYAGVNDGHTGSVPIRHSLDAFNVIATENGDEPITENEIGQLTNNRRLDSPRPSDQATDARLGLEIYLRRISRHARVTIFDGGHEAHPVPACQWLAEQSRATRHADRSK